MVFSVVVEVVAGVEVEEERRSGERVRADGAVCGD